MTFIKGETPEGANPFKKGQSGNPKGRPKGKSVSSILKELLDKKAPESFKSTEAYKTYLTDEEGLTNGEALAMVLLNKAVKQENDKSISELLDRTEGKPLQKTETKLDIESPNISLKVDGENISVKNDDEQPGDSPAQGE